VADRASAVDEGLAAIPHTYHVVPYMESLPLYGDYTSEDAVRKNGDTGHV
jgi:hypothetical protein